MLAFEFFLHAMELDFSFFSARMFSAFLEDHILVSSAKHFEDRIFSSVNQYAYPYDQNSNSSQGFQNFEKEVLRSYPRFLTHSQCAD